jgi:hypothetical protein
MPKLINDLKGQNTILLAFILICTFLCTFNAVHDPDQFWHLAFGKYIVENRTLITKEPFAFTTEGKEITDMNWLFNTGAYIVYKFFNYEGLQILTAVIAMLSMLLIILTIYQERVSLIALALYFSLFFRFFRSRFRPRPELIGLLLFSFLIYLLFLYRKGELKHKWLFTLIFLLWTQIHGTWTYALILIPFFIIEKNGPKLSKSLSKDVVYLILFPVLALFVNPYFYKPVIFPFSYYLTLKGNSDFKIDEWKAMELSPIVIPFYAFILCLAIFYFWRFIKKKESFFPICVIFLESIFIFKWARYNSFGFIALSYFSVSMISKGIKVIPQRLSKLIWLLGVFLLVIPAFWMVSYEPYKKWLPREFPQREANFILQSNLAGNLLHTYTEGGFLEFTTYPKCKTFFDGRHPDFLPYYEDYMRSMKGIDPFPEFVERYPFEIAVLPYYFVNKKSVNGTMRSGFLVILPKEKWAPVFYGPYGIVFVKRLPKYETQIKKWEYKVLFPYDMEFINSQIVGGKFEKEELKEEMERAYSDGAKFLND